MPLDRHTKKISTPGAETTVSIEPSQLFDLVIQLGRSNELVSPVCVDSRLTLYKVSIDTTTCQVSP
jgi:hypothetical protein